MMHCMWTGSPDRSLHTTELLTFCLDPVSHRLWTVAPKGTGTLDMLTALSVKTPIACSTVQQSLFDWSVYLDIHCACACKLYGLPTYLVTIMKSYQCTVELVRAHTRLKDLHFKHCPKQVADTAAPWKDQRTRSGAQERKARRLQWQRLCIAKNQPKKKKMWSALPLQLILHPRQQFRGYL